MLYEVTISYPKIKKKKIISSKELSKNYWASFEEKQKRFSTKKTNNDLVLVKQY